MSNIENHIAIIGPGNSAGAVLAREVIQKAGFNTLTTAEPIRITAPPLAELIVLDKKPLANNRRARREKMRRKSR